MEKEFVPYELALRMKALGFKEICYRMYFNEKLSPIIDGGGQYNHDGNITSAPLFQQAFRWFREKGIESEIHSDFDRMLGYNRGYIPVVQFIEFYNNGDCYDTYEEAELACLEKLLSIVELKQQEQ